MKTNAPNPTSHNQWYPFQDRPLPSRTGHSAENPSVVPVFETVPLPSSVRFVVIGAGVHGMSTAWHLAMALETSGIHDRSPAFDFARKRKGMGK